ncbi:MAG: DnaJ domain-containing protein [Labilithrix sp.]|nr:DnaJ domain-containing protein [Labilithrix sp.]
MADASDRRPAPSATGTIADRPLAHLLVYARNKRLTGKLELHAPDGRNGTIDLWRGRITATRTSPAVAYFGAVAYELGCIDTPTLDATLLEVAKQKRLHGEILVERGDLTTTQRDLILAEQTCRKVHALFAYPPEASFAFYESVPVAAEPPLTLDPIAPVWRGLRDHPPTESVKEIIARYASANLRMVNEGPVGRAGLTTDEMELCDAMAFKAMTIAQMRAASSLPSARLELLVYLLVITKCVEAQAPASSPSIPAAPESRPLPAPPSSRPETPRPLASGSQPRMPVMPRSVLTPGAPLPRTISSPAMAAAGSGEMRTVSMSFKVPSRPSFPAAAPVAASIGATFGPAEVGPVGIAERAARASGDALFESLGLADGASVEAVRAAFFRLTKLWHPDKLPADLEPFRVECTKIFDQMVRAHQVLTDPEQRKAHLDRRAAEKEPRPRKDVMRDIDTALMKRDFAFIEEHARALVEADGDDAEAEALVAWAITSAGEAPEDVLREALPALDRAVNTDRYCERAYYYRGVFHKRLGNSGGAFRDFSRVVQLNPKHIDAQREVRLFEMRARKGSGEHSLDALKKQKKK